MTRGERFTRAVPRPDAHAPIALLTTPSLASRRALRMYGDAALGARARALGSHAGRTAQECAALAEAAVNDAATLVADEDACLVPRGAACLFVRGRNDPVVEPQYVDAYYAFLKARTRASVEWHLFEKAQHAMAVVEAPEVYKAQHVERLLRQVPEFAAR